MLCSASLKINDKRSLLSANCTDESDRVNSNLSSGLNLSAVLLRNEIDTAISHLFRRRFADFKLKGRKLAGDLSYMH